MASKMEKDAVLTDLENNVATGLATWPVREVGMRVFFRP